MSERLFDVGDRQPDTSSGGTPPAAPLAARMRPRTLDEYVGQADLVGPDTSLGRMLRRGELTSLVLWGPPGSGKTSLAAVISRQIDAAWDQLSAVTAGVKDVRAVIERARTRTRSSGRTTILFLDEIHRFNKAQQDALLPAVEEGSIVLIGATTENPFFELNAPLLSRCTLLQLSPLSDEEVATIVRRAVDDPERGVGEDVAVPDATVARIAGLADGDARAGLNMLEVAAEAAREATDDTSSVEIGPDAVDTALSQFRYDRAGDAHYDQVSAFIKSLRGSDPDAAVYWLLRMLRGGEDPRFLARRMVIFASEDIGLAEGDALPLAVAAFRALDVVGLPEAKHNLVHAAVALAAAPKSNAVARALSAGERAVDGAANAAVPAHLRDSHYPGATDLGHGEGYDHPHDHPDGWVDQQYLPDALQGRVIYDPTDHGDEAPVRARIAELRRRRGGREDRPPGEA